MPVCVAVVINQSVALEGAQVLKQFEHFEGVACLHGPNFSPSYLNSNINKSAAGTEQ